MDNYIVSARKYRPQSFDTVVGQQALTTTLKNAIIENKLAHAYLFCGPRGVGKTTCARIFAKTINCEHRSPQGEACNECESCKAFNENRSVDIHEFDAASNNSVNDIRQIVEQVHIPPQIGQYRVFIFDEVHMLSDQAFNAFLKTLEEPPAHVVFILATTEKQKILPTILSRCQIYDFNRVSIHDIVRQLKLVADREQYSYDEEALNIIAQKADGGMRDALSMFDKVANFTKGQIYYKNVIQNLNVLDYDYYFNITEALLAHDIVRPLLLFNEILGKGFDGLHFINGFSEHLRNLLVCHDEMTLPLLEATEETRLRYKSQSEKCSIALLSKALYLCNNCCLKYQGSNNKRLQVELTLIQMAQMETDGGDKSPLPGLGPEQHINPIFSNKRQENKPKADSGKKRPSALPTKNIAKQSVPTEKKAQSTGGSNKSPFQITSLSDLLKNSETENVSITPEPKIAQSAPPKAVEGSSFSQAIDSKDVELEWLRFSNKLATTNAMLSGRLKAVKLAKMDNNHYNILVASDNAKEDIENVLPQLVQYFLDTLHASITFEIKTDTPDATQLQFSNETEAVAPSTYFKQLKEQNKAFAQLVQGLDLELL